LKTLRNHRRQRHKDVLNEAKRLLDDRELRLLLESQISDRLQ
jgi:hypothetical protein